MSIYKEYDNETLKKLQKVEIEMLKDVNYVCEKYNIKYFALDGTGIGAMRHKGFIPWDDDIDLRFTEADAIKFRKCMEKEMRKKYYFIDQNNGVYPVSFTKMCKKNTLFMDDAAYELNYDKLGIFIDIFPMVYVSNDKKVREKNLKKSWYLYKLGILSAIKKPTISYKGIKGKILLISFFILHYLLKIFRIDYKKLFKKAEKISKANEKTNILASLNTVKKLTSIYNTKDIFPVKKVPFEDTYVYVPKECDKLLRMYFGDYMKLPPEDKRHNHYPHKLIFDVRKEVEKND